MNKVLLFVLAFIFFTISCQSDSGNTSSHSANTDENNALSIAQLTCEMISEDEVSPKAAIYALVRENKIKIGEITTSTCIAIESDQYANYKIPAEALSAAGGWWAGAGDYFYIVEEEKEYVVMKGQLDEMMEGDMEYKRVAGLKK